MTKMLTFAYAELNVFAIIVLTLIFFNNYHHGDFHLFEQKLFWALISSNILILIMDTLQWLLDGVPGSLSRFVLLTATVVYYILNPLPCFLWSLYADYKIHRDENRLKSIFIPMTLPFLLNLVLSVMSIWGKYLYYIDTHNSYHRGSLFFILALTCYSYLISSMVLVIIKRKQVHRKTYLSLLMFAVLPYIAGIIQALVYGFSLIWISMAISILMVYLNIQNSQMYTDHLTGLHNRKQLDSYLHEWSKRKSGKLLAGVMIDIDAFKTINDRWGHDAGDDALTKTARILERSFKKDDLICRYGGDEFVVISLVHEKSELEKSIENLSKNAELFNRTKTAPYQLRFSVGCDVCAQNDDIGFQQFFKQIDQKMYADKRSKCRKKEKTIVTCPESAP